MNEVELGTVTLIDSETLTVIKEIPIDRVDKRTTFDINHRVMVTLDRDVLIITVQVISFVASCSKQCLRDESSTCRAV